MLTLYLWVRVGNIKRETAHFSLTLKKSSLMFQTVFLKDLKLM